MIMTRNLLKVQFVGCNKKSTTVACHDTRIKKVIFFNSIIFYKNTEVYQKVITSFCEFIVDIATDHPVQSAFTPF